MVTYVPGVAATTDQEPTRDCRYQAAIVDGPNVLLLRVRAPGSERTFWLVPGGGREPGESEEACVLREVREETDLSVEVVRLLWEEPVLGDPTYRRTKTYLCRVIGGALRPGSEPEFEHHAIEEAGWFPIDDARSWPPLIRDDRLTSLFLRKLGEALSG